MSRGPLNDLLVVDLGNDLLAFGGTVLAALGAEVVLVEPPGGGDARAVPPVFHASGGPVSAHFLSTAAGKRSVTADLTRPDGQALVRRLLAGADVALVTDDDEALRERGLDLTELRVLNERLIVTSLTPFGRSGPRRRWKGSDLTAWASSGAMVPIGEADRPPLVPGGSMAAAAGSLNAVAGTLVALRARDRTGRGQVVDISLQEAVLSVNGESGPTFTLEDLAGVGFRRLGRIRGAVQGMFPTKDGMVELLPFMPGQWDALAEWIKEELGIEEATMDTFRGPVGVRAPYAELLNGWLEQLTCRYTKHEFLLEAQKRAIPTGSVNEPADLLTDPQLQAVDAWVEATVPGVGELRWPRPPLRFDDEALSVGRVPDPGEANLEIWGERLGLGPDELERLAEAGAV